MSVQAAQNIWSRSRRNHVDDDEATFAFVLPQEMILRSVLMPESVKQPPLLRNIAAYRAAGALR